MPRKKKEETAEPEKKTRRRTKKEEKKEVHEEKKEIRRTRKKERKVETAYIAGGIVLLIILAAVGYYIGTSANAGVGPAVASQHLAQWIKGYFASKGANVDINIVKVEPVSGLYRVTMELSLQGRTQEVNYFVSKDGKYFFPVGIDISQIPTGPTIPKSNKPDIKLFVMSYCPYGMQMEKALLPVLRLLGDKVNFQLEFVSYAMHGPKEAWEDLRQYCIQKDYGRDVLLNYLQCFDIDHPGDANTCMKVAGVDVNKINACMQQLDKEYNISGYIAQYNKQGGGIIPIPMDRADNVKYGVQGSPTLVINGTVVNPQRTPEALKNAICSAFLNPPAECNQTLSNTAENAPAGQCG